MNKAWMIGALAMLGGPVLATAQAAEAERTEASQEAQAYIISPQNGETVGKTFKVKFGLSGMGVAPAGVDVKHTGHHHLLIDKEHTLQLILGDKNHVPHNPAVVSEKITVIVKDD